MISPTKIGNWPTEIGDFTNENWENWPRDVSWFSQASWRFHHDIARDFRSSRLGPMDPWKWILHDFYTSKAGNHGDIGDVGQISDIPKMGDLESSKHAEVDGSTIAEKMGDVSLWFFLQKWYGRTETIQETRIWIVDTCGYWYWRMGNWIWR